MSELTVNADTEIQSNRYVVYKSDGNKLTITSSGELNCTVQSGDLVITKDNNTIYILPADKWVSVNIDPSTL